MESTAKRGLKAESAGFNLAVEPAYIAFKREYKSWASMKQRCLNPRCAKYKYYGGRGIGFCDRWQVFDNFLQDMGQRPPHTTLDRINTNGNYEPSNCRWATGTEQNLNTRLNSRNKTGVTGVSYNNKRKRWHSRIQVYGKEIHLGYFKTSEEAKLAREQAQEEIFKQGLVY